MAQTTDKILLNIILIGKSGHGKSATGNSILGRTAFKRYPHLHSGTQFVTDAWAEHGPYEIKVVDGPGLKVTDLGGVKNKEQMFENMTTALRMCNGGTHVFVLVIKFRFRYTEEHRKAIYGLKEIFGENYLKNRGIIVMTGGYYFSGQMEADGTPGKTFKEWCREQDNVLGDLIAECSPRVVLFNNLPTSDEEQTRQRSELLFHAGQLHKGHFQTCALMRSKFIKDTTQKMLKETIQERIDMFSAELGQLSMDSSLEDVDTLGARITGVFMEIGDEDLQEESLQQLTDTLVALRITTEELSRAIQETNLTAMTSTLTKECRQRKELPFHAEQLQKEFRSTPIYRMVQRMDRIPLNLILIGKTGHGKSATGNAILGRKAFKTSSNTFSETQFVTVQWAEHGLYEVKIVDGPGLEDPDLDRVNNKKQACENMATALMMCNGGVHAFVLVIKFGYRYTEEERRVISDLKQIFGENYLKDHGIIVMTGGDYFSGQMEADGAPGKTFKEWCREQCIVFGNLIKECSPGVVLFNNTSKSEEEKTRQRDELLFHAGRLQQVKGLYTTDHFQAYAQMRSKFIKDNKQKILEETMQKRINLLSAEFDRLSVDSSLEDVDKLDARITDVYTEIGEESPQEESMQQLIYRLKRLSTTTKELRRAIQEKNPKAIKSKLAAMSQHQEELNKTSKIPWGRIAACIGIGLVGAAFVAGGTAAIVLSDGVLAPVVVSLAKLLTDVAATYLKDKL